MGGSRAGSQTTLQQDEHGGPANGTSTESQPQETNPKATANAADGRNGRLHARLAELR